MVGTDPIWHGGDLATARALFPQAAEPWIDLSTGINPHAYPLPDLPDDVWRRLPGREAEEKLLAAARVRYRVAPDQDIVPAPGTQVLIQLLPRLVAARSVCVLGPTYAEHALAWRQTGASVDEVYSPPTNVAGRVMVVVNPNNPDGRVLPPHELQSLSKAALLVFDEAFADFDDGISIVPMRLPRTVVLRSFGKTYGLAGLRLGFAIGDRAIIEGLRRALGPWAVSGPALAMGTAALADDAWLADQQAARARDAARLDALLAPLGTLVGGTVLYRLLESPAAPALFDHLGQAGIYVRRFADNPTRLRFGLPPDEPAWRRLESALVGFRDTISGTGS